MLEHAFSLRSSKVSASSTGIDVFASRLRALRLALHWRCHLEDRPLALRSSPAACFRTDAYCLAPTTEAGYSNDKHPAA